MLIFNLFTIFTSSYLNQLTKTMDKTAVIYAYTSALKDLEADEREAEIALEKASVNLSNLASYIEEIIQIACKLSSYWNSKDFEVCQKIQKMVFPNGVKWNKETREIRTIETNKFLDIIYNISRTYVNDTTQKKDKS